MTEREISVHEERVTGSPVRSGETKYTVFLGENTNAASLDIYDDEYAILWPTNMDFDDFREYLYQNITNFRQSDAECVFSISGPSEEIIEMTASYDYVRSSPHFPDECVHYRALHGSKQLAWHPGINDMWEIVAPQSQTDTFVNMYLSSIVGFNEIGYSTAESLAEKIVGLIKGESKTKIANWREI